MTFLEVVEEEIVRAKMDVSYNEKRLKHLEETRDLYREKEAILKAEQEVLTLSGSMVEIPLKAGQEPRFTLTHMNPELETQLWEGIKKGGIDAAIVDEEFGGIVAYGSRPMVDHLLERLN